MRSIARQIVTVYFGMAPNASLVRHRSGKVHLMRFFDDGVALCGSEMRAEFKDRDLPLGRGEQWCYSCLGNALEMLEHRYEYLH